MSKRQLPGCESFEFRARDQSTLLREVAAWFGKREAAKIPPFLLDIRFDLREQDIDAPEPYTAVVHVDGEDLSATRDAE